MMRYVCIDDGAVAELISGREYQSVDFHEGAKLVDVLSGNTQFYGKQGNITLVPDEEGVFLTTPGSWRKKKYAVIDCEQSELFFHLSRGQSLASLQKLLRFCTKYWNHDVFNKSEKIIPGTSKAILFPLPYENNNPFRVAIERHPLKERLRKRQMDGNFLLVYKSGRQAADSATETPDEGVFRKVFSRLPEIYETVTKTASDFDGPVDAAQLASTTLTDSVSSAQSIHSPFSKWRGRLTEQQQKFIDASFDTPHRLEGPAGTGKTLSLILRTTRVLMEAESTGETRHALLVTHSEATREAIADALLTIDENGFQTRDRQHDDVTLSVQTLASLCAAFLQTAISETEFVDRDAQDSKLLQQMYIEQAIRRRREEELPSFLPHLSVEFREFFQKETDDRLSAMFQHEIGVLIKGRAGDSFEVYKNCPSLKYGLPINNSADKGFSFSVFEAYQQQLQEANQFDTDDVVISAVGQLDTPIWRRRRAREGFDFIAVDETHLFNINELQVFHHFTKGSDHCPISFTVDRAQAVGDRGWNDLESFDALFGDRVVPKDSTNVRTVFRCAPDIAEFCYGILASGATLFTSFVNTMSSVQSSFTAAEERRAQGVRYSQSSNDDAMVAEAFRAAEDLRGKTECNRADVLVTTLSEELLGKIKEYATANNKAVSYLERRGDFRQVSVARNSGQMVVAHADFVGGLEFGVVVIVGVDKGRVPHEGESTTANSRTYANYAAHNRLYVAASRAKFALRLMGDRNRGASDLLAGVAANGLIKGVN